METEGITFVFSDPNLQKRLSNVSGYHDWVGSLLDQDVPKFVLEWGSGIQTLVEGWCIRSGFRRGVVHDSRFGTRGTLFNYRLMWNVEFLVARDIRCTLDNPLVELFSDDGIVFGGKAVLV
jgi:hypothetical protein